MQLTMLVTIRCCLHHKKTFLKQKTRKTARAICVQLSNGSLNHTTRNVDHTSLSPSSLFEPKLENMLSRTPQHPSNTQQQNTNAKHNHPSHDPVRNTEPPNTPTPDPTAQHPNNPTPNPSCGVAKHHDPKKEEAKQHHPTEEKGNPPKGGKGRQHNNTQRRRPSSTTVLERGSHADTEIDENVQPYVQPENVESVPKLQTSTDVRLLDETRRRAICRAAQQAFLHESTTTNICATTCGSGQGNGTNCVRNFEVVKKPNKFQTFNSEFPSS